MSTTPFMNLSLPTPTVTLGPAWASQLNAALNLVDSHDHSDTKGTRVKTNGISINADLPFNSFGASLLSYLQLNSQPASLPGLSYARNIYSVGDDLWYTNGSGAAVQITSGGSLGSISGSVNQLEYNPITTDTTLVSADGPALGRTLQAVTSSVAPITVTLPLAADVAAGRLFVIKDVSGNSETYPLTIAADGADSVDGGTTLVINSNFGAAFLASDGVSNWFAV
jgi:hypothetical protein